MSDIAIKVEGLSKQYLIGEKQEKYKTLRDTMIEMASLPYRKLRALMSGAQSQEVKKEEFWALNSISFEVKQGEVVGVIGRNGAGKSTLLKILSRITEPSKGYVDIHGRIGSLLEVGTGFHPELTGRENVYLNGAILGMKRAEILRQFDQIVSFAEVERFIDTPVKHYSSGMYLRLAFSVAAHLEPEILLVDEVLAVGDMAFQKKCLGKMEDVAAQGRTVLFVSHNLGAIKELCQSCIVLDGGALDFQGPAVQGLFHYSQNILSRQLDGAALHGSAWTQIRVQHQNDTFSEPIHNDEPIVVEASLNLSDDLEKGRLFCLIEDSNGDGIVHNFIDVGYGDLQAGIHNLSIEIPPLWLMPNAYMLYFKLIGRTTSGKEERFLSERVILNITDKSNRSVGKIRAVLTPPIEWSLTEANSGNKQKALVNG
jgi:lipopolysaccharide transport system ATP-binding protein